MNDLIALPLCIHGMREQGAHANITKNKSHTRDL
jgi:hypothetical protein